MKLSIKNRHLQIAITPIGIPLCKIQLDSSNYLYLLPYSNFQKIILHDNFLIKQCFQKKAIIC